MDSPIENFADNDGAVEAGNLDNQKRELEDDVGTIDSDKRWPGWPGDSVFRILVPANKVGSIIGKKGEFIKKMCEESKARIKILDAPQGVPERTVIISAREEQDALISPSMDGLLKVHKRLLDGLEGEAHTPNAGHKVPTRLLVAMSQAKTLIGKQGSTIKSIQEASNSVVRVLEELPPVALPDDKLVEIIGEPAGMHKAVELIANQLRKFLVDRSVIALFEKNMLINQLPMEPVMRQSMPPTQNWGHPQALPPSSGPNYGSNSQFIPPPRPHDSFYPQADYHPQDIPPHHGISTYGRDAPPMGVHQSTNQQASMVSQQVTHRMQIPLSYADAVIGAAGSNISYIRRTSGATVTIQETRGVPGEMTVEIIGTATQVQTAQQLIQNFMAGAGAPNQAPPASGHNQMAPADHGYGSSYQAHGHMYGSSSNAAPAAHSSGGYGPSYGGNYGY